MISAAIMWNMEFSAISLRGILGKTVSKFLKNFLTISRRSRQKGLQYTCDVYLHDAFVLCWDYNTVQML